jgi:hypothetical protein
MDAVVIADLVAEPVRVDFRVLREGDGGGLQQYVVDGDL